MCKSNFFWYVGALLLVVLSMVVGSYFQLLKDVPNRNGGVEWGLVSRDLRPLSGSETAALHGKYLSAKGHFALELREENSKLTFGAFTFHVNKILREGKDRYFLEGTWTNSDPQKKDFGLSDKYPQDLATAVVELNQPLLRVIIVRLGGELLQFE
jgi:hypothetical protein